jgi:hypothetical protein
MENTHVEAEEVIAEARSDMDYDILHSDMDNWSEQI